MFSYFGSILYVGLLFTNAIAILSEDRFLAKIGWSTRTPVGNAGFGHAPNPTIYGGDYGSGSGSGSDSASIKLKLVNLIGATRTLMRIPLIVVNVVMVRVGIGMREVHGVYVLGYCSKLAPPAAPEGPLSPAAAQQIANSTGIADFELPKTSLIKLAKGSIPDNVKMQQDVVVALLRSSTLFISYLRKSGGVSYLYRRDVGSITASDVIKAIVELDFGPADNLLPLLEIELAAYRNNVLAAKASKVKPSGPGRGRGRRSNAGQEDVEMGEGGDGDGFDDGGISDEELGGEGDQSALVEGGDEEDREEDEDIHPSSS
ncbi:MAG: hypothetical protein TREMPRED_001357 [Tremellales sp. Tagirdzhanova-0007]|nr:MAG: hypothetical protein TREMPRED_001357 [Tremellales sp. Tagirdzhanova-0007]